MRKAPLHAFLFGLGAIALGWSLSTNSGWIWTNRLGATARPFDDLWGFALAGGLLVILGSLVLEPRYSNWAAWVGVAACAVGIAWPWMKLFTDRNITFVEPRLWIATIGVVLLVAGAAAATVRGRTGVTPAR